MPEQRITEEREAQIRAGIAQVPEDNAFAWARGQISLDDLRGLFAEIDHLRSENAEWEASFKLYHSADMRGIAMWQAEAPKERELIHPDKGNLVAWLLKRLDEAEGAVDTLARIWNVGECVLGRDKKCPDDDPPKCPGCRATDAEAELSTLRGEDPKPEKPTFPPVKVLKENRDPEAQA